MYPALCKFGYIFLITVCMCKVLSETVAKALDFYGNEEATDIHKYI